MYIAVTYIGGKYVPGEVIPDDMPRDKLDWLIRAGAVRKAASDPDSRQRYEAAAGQEAEAPDLVAAPEDAEGTDDIQEPEDEIDEDEEAPEIDVMAGIVQDGGKDAEKPAPARKPRTASGNKKAPKGGKAK